MTARVAFHLRIDWTAVEGYLGPAVSLVGVIFLILGGLEWAIYLAAVPLTMASITTAVILKRKARRRREAVE